MSSDDDDDMPLASMVKSKSKSGKKRTKIKPGDAVMSTPKKNVNSKKKDDASAAKKKRKREESSSKPDKVASSASASAKKETTKKAKTASASAAATTVRKELKKLDKAERLQYAMQSFLWWNAKEPPVGCQWEKMEHAGVSFPEPYLPHRVRMKYDGKPVDLNPVQEEA